MNDLIDIAIEVLAGIDGDLLDVQLATSRFGLTETDVRGLLDAPRSEWRARIVYLFRP